MPTDRCRGYCGVSCVNGSCPIANISEYEERCYAIIHNCNECYCYKGCEDCAFRDTNNCIKVISQEN